MGDSWTVEAWFSLSPIARQNLRQNLLEQKLQANDPQPDVHFGNSVAISDNFALIGANLEDTGSDYAGSAYIFTLSLPEPSRVLVASSNGDTPITIKDKSKLGTVIEGVFYDSGYDLIWRN